MPIKKFKSLHLCPMSNVEFGGFIEVQFIGG